MFIDYKKLKTKLDKQKRQYEIIGFNIIYADGHFEPLAKAVTRLGV
jgi:hypothetical protein